MMPMSKPPARPAIGTVRTCSSQQASTADTWTEHTHPRKIHPKARQLTALSVDVSAVRQRCQAKSLTTTRDKTDTGSRPGDTHRR